MKSVLVVSPGVPWPLDSGGRIRTFRLLEQVAKRVPVTLWCVAEPRPLTEAAAALEASGLKLAIFPRSRPAPLARWIEPKIERWFASSSLDQALAASARDHDLVHLDELLLARRLMPAKTRAVIVHHHKLDLEFQRSTGNPRSPTQRWDNWKLARLEALAAARWPHHITCSEQDRQLLLARHGQLTITALPSGFDPLEFSPSRPSPQRVPNRLCFVGSLDYVPNLDGLEWFLDSVWPLLRRRRPDLELELVGRGAGARAQALVRPAVRLVGAVASVRPHLEQAALGIVPLRIGGGTRLKVVEALALGTPLVSTPIGAEGLELEDGRHLALAAAPAEFAERVLELLADPQRASQLGHAGREQVAERYPWSRLAEGLLAAWESAARAGRQA
jgi:glycosyltransferase involved in cell wall biosynthesis